MTKKSGGTYYHDYLELNKVLDSQHPKSDINGQPAHDEMLFIIIHQVYELWFKLILHELTSVIEIFSKDKIDEKDIGKSVSRLERISEIKIILVNQLNVLETMTPLDFLEFRDFLIPASGFQSVQFRILESLLGLKSTDRLLYNNQDYRNTLSPQHRKMLESVSGFPSMLELVNKWLERTPFLKTNDFDFWAQYREAVVKMLANDRKIIEENRTLSPEKKRSQLENLESVANNFESVFDEKIHNKRMENGMRRFSYKATLAALFINLYRDEPILNMPFRFLMALSEADELLTTWRYRHSLMVHRMIGSKIGTGGSSGHKYLLETVEKHRIYTDLFNLTSYLIPRAELPKLPESMQKELGFYYRQ
jgi:tryptophan 2,3-dioxygenase